MDAITLLKDDHHTVELLFKRFEQAGDRAHVQKRQIVDRIIEELSVHAAIEEQVFYPVARGAVPATEDIALESLEEHHIVKWLLAELVDMDPAHERFDAKVTVLIENVRHHVKEEETEFFPLVRDQLGRNELAELGETLADAKKSAPTRPHPRMPDEGPTNVVAGTITGVVDRVGDNLSGIAQGGVSAVGDLIARFTGSDRAKVSPTGSSTARKRASGVRSAATTATDGVHETARSAKSAATSTAKAAKAGAKGTATSAKKSARATATTAKRASTTTGRTARSASKKTAATAKRTASKTAKAATGAR
jgi:hemerythrin superfamily protein